MFDSVKLHVDVCVKESESLCSCQLLSVMYFFEKLHVHQWMVNHVKS